MNEIIKFRIILSLLIIILLFPKNLYANSITDYAIKVGGDNHLPPYMYINDNGIYKGFSVDLLHAIAIELKMDIEINPMPWYEIPVAIEKGDIDIILGMNKSETFSSYYDYSQPYLTISQGIFVRQSNRFIVDLEDLSSVRVAVQKGNIPNELLNYVEKEDLYLVDNQQQGILLLMMGKVDAFVGNRLVGLYTIQKWKQTNFIKIVGEPIEPTDYCFAVKKNNIDLLKVFNDGLYKIQENGTYKKIYNKWFGEIIRTPSQIWKEIIYNILVVAFVVIIVLLVIIRGNQLLKKEIKKQTIQLENANKNLRKQNLKIKEQHILKQQILDNIIHIIFTFDKKGFIKFYNKKADSLFNNNWDNDFTGKHYSETPLLSYIEIEHLENTLTNGKYYMNKEKFVEVNGAERIYDYSVYPIKYFNNELNGAILNLRDITEEKKIQLNLIQRDKMESLGQLVAVLAHEIRNPLTSIKTFIDIMPEKIDDSKFRRMFLKYVPKEFERIEQLVIDLLIYAKPRQSKRVEVNIEEVVNEILVLLKNKLLQNGIELLLDVHDNLVAFVDKYQLKQILINLLFNSIQACKEGSQIIITARNEIDKCSIQIKDTGTGIPRKYLNKVMEPFFTTKKEGTGLGLSICYQLIKENNGEITIESQENKGTVVTIKIPASYERRNHDNEKNAYS